VSENGDRQRRGSGGIVSAVRGALERFAGLTQLERVPSTTSVMATYRVDIDAGGDLTGYERLRRFTRGSVDSS
jgi:hypothetical protein